MPVAMRSEKMRELIDENAEVEQVATGFTFTEGPIWMSDGSLHFSDMPGDKRRRWHPDEGVTVLLELSRKCNGMTRDNDGNLIVCEHVTSSVVRELPDGRRETLAYHWGDKYLNSPNDVIVASDGSIIFTDPTYGRMPGFGIERSQELDLDVLRFEFVVDVQVHARRLTKHPCAPGETASHNPQKRYRPHECPPRDLVP